MAGCVPSWMCPRGAAFLGESRGEQAQGLVLVGRQGGAVAVEVAGDAAAGGARAVTERLYASLSLKLCKGERETERESRSRLEFGINPQSRQTDALLTDPFVVALL